MAHKQGLEILIDSARELQSRKRLKFVFCGDGPGKPALVKLALHSHNVICLPLQSAEHLNHLLNLADIHLLPQKAGAADLVMPSKLTGMLASGRPVVATAQAGTQLAEVVEGKGIVVPPGNIPAFCRAIVQLSDDPHLRANFGRNARDYAVSNLEKDVVLGQFEIELRRCATASLSSH